MNFRPSLILILASGMVLSVWLAALPRDGCAADPIASGTSSRQARQMAISSVPFNELNRETQQKIAPILEKPSIYRRLPVTSADVDPDLYLFLVRHPEVLVNIWKLMGVTQMTVDRTGPFNFTSDDGAGAVSEVELIYGTSHKNVYYAEGAYSGPLLKRSLKGRAVIILNTNYQRGPEGKPLAVSSLDVFLKVENATISLIARTLNPVVGPTADHNFVETIKFVQRLNETTSQNGVGVQRMAYRLTQLDDGVREKFIEIAGGVYQRNIQLTNASAGITAARDVPTPSSSPSTNRAVRPTSYRDYQYGFER